MVACLREIVAVAPSVRTLSNMSSFQQDDQTGLYLRPPTTSQLCKSCIYCWSRSIDSADYGSTALDVDVVSLILCTTHIPCCSERPALCCVQAIFMADLVSEDEVPFNARGVVDQMVCSVAARCPLAPQFASVCERARVDDS